MRRILVSLVPFLALTAFARAQELYDDTLLRTYKLTFHQANWWTKLVSTMNTENYIKADLEIDNVTYPDVGIQVRGAASHFCAKGQKVPFKIKTDAFVADQEVYGYDSFRLNNGAGDPTFLREAIMSKVLSEYIPMAKRAFVVLDFNGESWGVYINEQQKDATYAKEWFGVGTGNRYKAIWPAALTYEGPNPGPYKAQYTHVNGPTPDAYTDLIHFCDVLNNTPKTDLVDALLPLVDYDAVLWAMVGNNLFGNGDSYQNNSHNYYVLHDDWHDRFYFQTHDLDLSFGTWKSLSPTFSLTWEYAKASRPLTSRIWKSGTAKEQYFAHVQTMAERSFNWDVIGPLAWRYHDLIDAAVAADAKKNYTYQQFKDGITQDITGGACWIYFPGIQPWVEQRSAYALSQVAGPRVAFGSIRHLPGSPAPLEDVLVTAVVDPSELASNVQLRYRVGRGHFTRTPMFDDGLHGDGAANDLLYAATIPGGAPGDRIEYVLLGTGVTANKKTFAPRKAEAEPFSLSVKFGTQGLRITEYMYSGAGPEFLELTNTSASSIDLTGWSVDDSSAKIGTFDLGAGGVVDPGKSIVVTDADAAGFRAAWNLAPSTIVLGGNTDAKLGRNDSIHLFGPWGVPMDRLTYGDELFPGSVRAQGTSAWACDTTIGADDPYAWQLAGDGDVQGAWTSSDGDVGSPGSFVGVPCPALGDEYCTSNPNSTGQAATLSASGSAVLGDNDLTLLAGSVPAGQQGYFLLAPAQGNVPGFGGSQGVLCLGGSITRFDAHVLSSGATNEMSFRPDLSALPNDVAIQPGETWNFQLWYRDDNPGPTSNTSSALAITFL